MSYYGPDLAFIHDAGFGQLASGAGRVLLGEFQRSGIDQGTVVDIGCGSGITAQLLSEAGYSVLGIDLSGSLVEIARQRAPQATFRVGSFIDMALSPCVAVCAIGEVLNYSFDDRNGKEARIAFFERVFSSLASGGLFLFDVAGPDRAPDQLTRTFVEGEGWTVLVETHAEASVLFRRIVTYRRSGELYRRDSEEHRLQLLPPGEIESELQAIGFGAARISRYAEQPLLKGLHGFIAGRR